MTSRRCKPALMFLLVAVLAFRAVLPTGWMPVSSAEGIRIELCTGQGMVVATLAPDGRITKGEPDPDTPREPCPYGTLAQAADLPTLPILAEAPRPEKIQPAPLVEQELVRSLHAPRPPTRGPPSLA